MVTGVKPDEQVDWSEVDLEARARANAAAGVASGECSKVGCSKRAAGHMDGYGFPAVFCGAHFFELGAISALTVFGTAEGLDALGMAAALAESLGVRDV